MLTVRCNKGSYRKFKVLSLSLKLQTYHPSPLLHPSPPLAQGTPQSAATNPRPALAHGGGRARRRSPLQILRGTTFFFLNSASATQETSCLVELFVIISWVFLLWLLETRAVTFGFWRVAAPGEETFLTKAKEKRGKEKKKKRRSEVWALKFNHSPVQLKRHPLLSSPLRAVRVNYFYARKPASPFIQSVLNTCRHDAKVLRHLRRRDHLRSPAGHRHWPGGGSGFPHVDAQPPQKGKKRERNTPTFIH